MVDGMAHELDVSRGTEHILTGRGVQNQKEGGLGTSYQLSIYIYKKPNENYLWTEQVRNGRGGYVLLAVWTNVRENRLSTTTKSRRDWLKCLAFI
jgi:hypothetical protein